MSVIVPGLVGAGAVLAGCALAAPVSAAPERPVRSSVTAAAAALTLVPVAGPERDTDPDNSPFDPWEVRDAPGSSGSAAAGGDGSAAGGNDASGGDGPSGPGGVEQALAATGFDAPATASLGGFVLALGLGLVRLSRRSASAPRR